MPCRIARLAAPRTQAATSLCTTMAAVPATDAVTIAARADDFERRFRQQHAEAFRPRDTPIAWIALAVVYLRISDENSNPRSLDQQLFNVLHRVWREGVFVLSAA